MYPPPLFREDRVDVLHDLVRAHPLGLLVTLGGNGLQACHVPMLIDGVPAPYGALFGHVTRANPVLSAYDQETGALAVFQGPQHYVTPSWYPSKRTDDGRVVPTWNYMAVHARGRLTFHDDPAWLRTHLTALVDMQERGRDEPWAVTDAPAEFIDRQVKGIIGFEITITDLMGTWKVSQNRQLVDQAGVVAGLREIGSEAALAMAEVVAERAAVDPSGRA